MHEEAPQTTIFCGDFGFLFFTRMIQEEDDSKSSKRTVSVIRRVTNTINANDSSDNEQDYVNEHQQRRQSITESSQLAESNHSQYQFRSEIDGMTSELYQDIYRIENNFQSYSFHNEQTLYNSIEVENSRNNHGENRKLFANSTSEETASTNAKRVMMQVKFSELIGISAAEPKFSIKKLDDRKLGKTVL
jgi:hypothetical protein